MRKVRKSKAARNEATVIDIARGRSLVVQPADRATREVRDSELRRLRDALDADDVVSAVEAFGFLVNDGEDRRELRACISAVAQHARSRTVAHDVTRQLGELEPRAYRLGVSAHHPPSARIKELERIARETPRRPAENISDVTSPLVGHVSNKGDERNERVLVTSGRSWLLANTIRILFPSLERAADPKLSQAIEKRCGQSSDVDVVREALLAAGATLSDVRKWTQGKRKKPNASRPKPTR
jgi:hypothetical protein